MKSKYFIRKIGKDNVLYKVDDDVSVYHQRHRLTPHIKQIWRKSNEFDKPKHFYGCFEDFKNRQLIKEISEEEAFEWVMLQEVNLENRK